VFTILVLAPAIHEDVPAAVTPAGRKPITECILRRLGERLVREDQPPLQAKSKAAAGSVRADAG
jgi:hypothetical protein